MPEGVVKYQDRHIVWNDDSGNSWSLPLDDMRIVAEWIDDDGISVDPEVHRLVFVDTDGRVFDIWARTSGVEFLLRDLAGTLPEFQARLKLYGHTTDSRIIWPTRLMDQPLFKVVKVKPKTIYDRIMGLLADVTETCFADEVTQYLCACASRKLVPVVSPENVIRGREESPRSDSDGAQGESR